MKIGHIVQIVNVLSQLSNEKMNVQTAYKIHKLLKLMDPDLQFFNKKREELFQKYGIMTSDNRYIIDPEKEDVAGKEFDEIVSLESNIEISPSLKITLKDLEKLSLSPNEIGILEHIIQEDLS